MTDPSKVGSNVRPTQGTEPSKSLSEVKSQDVAGREATDGYRFANQVARANDRQASTSFVINLPGLGRVIIDRRGERGQSGESADPKAERGRSERGEAREEREAGRAEGKEAGEKSSRAGGGSSFVAVVKKAQGEMAAAEAAAALKMSQPDAEGRALSEFEKTLIARFEEAAQQAAESFDGQFHFLKKTAAEWTGFFEKFLSRSMQKVVNWDEVQGLLFRGLLQEKGTQKGVMISDVMTALGTDKFARISVALAKAQQLAAANPGAVISKEALQAAAFGEQLQYVAINPQTAEDGGVQFAQAASRGMFTSQNLESRVAEQLGLISEFRGALAPGAADSAEEASRRAGGRQRRGGRWSRWFGGDEAGGEGSVFVPWWRWDREERSGFRRWFVVVFGSVIFVVLIFLIMALVRALRT